MAEGEDGSAMKELTSTSWGYLIAFLLPGVFGLYALSYWFQQAGGLLQPILKADTTVGPSVVFLLVAVGVGLCLSAARYWALEKCAYGLLGEKCLSDTLHRSLKPDQFTLLRAYAEEHYRYHQFYGGCCVAGLILFAGWWRGQWPFKGAFAWNTVYVSLGLVVFELLLERSSYDAFKKYVEKCNALAG
jgi:hypothetical protein